MVNCVKKEIQKKKNNQLIQNCLSTKKDKYNEIMSISTNRFATEKQHTTT